MLQITSINKETAIAPELVQNGDFSELGADLVTNGDFSGTGSELVTNGDFATDTDWTKGVGWTISGGTANCDGTQVENSNLYQAVYTISNSYKTTIDVIVTAGTLIIFTGTSSETITITSSGTYNFSGLSSSSIVLYIQAQSDFIGSVDNVSVKELGADWTVGGGWSIGEDKAIADGSVLTSNLLTQDCGLVADKSYKISFESNRSKGTLFVKDGVNYDDPTIYTLETGTGSATNTFYTKWAGVGGELGFYAFSYDGSITNVTVQQLDPDEDWILSNSSLSIGENKGVFTNSLVGDNFNQQKFTIEENVSYRATFDLLDYESGVLKWRTTGGSEIGGSYNANETGITFDFIGDVEGGTLGVILFAASISNNNFAVTNISVKKLATYLDQSIYVTAADVQTIAQPIVSYLVELTSMSSQNSLYFIPTSITPNNGRYTKMNFTVVSKDGIIDPADGIISFYDADGGEDTYPMGFYKFKIYEQPFLPVNLDPTLATKLLEEGTAFVQNISGNTSEITSAFNEYDPTLTQYVYSQ